ncbi:MAG: hypothetical protein EOL95_09470 [Bacteroidia bacterium]|nr:hypothetical protein [Bacteroidia bacterium]
MFDFLEYIKTYIQTQFANDSQITTAKKPNVYNAYQINHEPIASKPEIQVQIMNNNERNGYTTFCGKKANTISVQFTPYIGGQMKIGGVDRNAQESSIIFGDKIEKMLYDLIYSNGNENIYGGRIITTSPALPMNGGGTIYMTAVRFEFIVASPYID